MAKKIQEESGLQGYAQKKGRTCKLRSPSAWSTSASGYADRVITNDVHVHESVVYCDGHVSLLQVDDHCDGFLDLPDDQDAGEHVLQLLSDDGLGGVPDGAVGCHYRLRRQVESVVAALSALWTEERQQERKEEI